MSDISQSGLELAAGRLKLRLTPIETQEPGVRVDVAFEAGSIEGRFQTQLINRHEFLRNLIEAQGKMDGSAELVGDPSFRLTMSIHPDGSAEMLFSYDDHGDVGVQARGLFDQSYIPSVIAQVASFYRSEDVQ